MREVQAGCLWHPRGDVVPEYSVFLVSPKDSHTDFFEDWDEETPIWALDSGFVTLQVYLCRASWMRENS